MKTLLALGILCLSTIAFSSDALLQKCGPIAEKSVKKAAGKGYDRDGFIAYQCDLAPNKQVVICLVGASKGGGEANDDYRAILNKSCTSALRVDLIGEE